MQAQQQELFAPTRARTSREFAAYLADGNPREVHLVATRNRVSMITIDFSEPGPIRIRLHEQFLRASHDIQSVLKRYLRTRKRADWKTLCDYAEEIPTADTPRPSPRLRTQGSVYDLCAVMKAVNRTFFNGRVKCGITWGQMPKRRKSGRRRCMNYGSYSDHDNLVTIHPLLDSKRVPRAFLEYVVYHEMLHAVVPSERRNGRWIHHSKQFRTLEQAYPDFERMKRLADTLYKKL